jgi:hypothetical protein
MTRHQDEDIRVALRRLRADDEQSAPPFEQLLTGGAADQVRRASRSTWPLPVALAATVVVAIGAYLITSKPRLTVPQEVVALSAWRPATDVLLDTPGRRLLMHAPELGASLIDLKGGIPR